MEKNKKEQVPKDYIPPSPIYDSTHKEDDLPICDLKIKQALDPEHYPPNYVSKQGEDAPTLADSLVAMPAKMKEEEEQGEDTKEENNEEHPKEEEHWTEDKGSKTGRRLRTRIRQ